MKQKTAAIQDTYDALIADILSTSNNQNLLNGNALKMERVALLLEYLGNPQTQFRSIHVGGTSGKGSTTTAIATILRQLGYTTGLYLSPHLQIYNERMQINNQLISTTMFAQLWQDIKPYVYKVEEALPQFGKPSFFEITTAMSFCWFALEKVDVAVVEVGLGGDLDATNVIPAEVSVITSVGLDHTHILGDTVEKIAFHKAGIIKKGQQFITAADQDTVLDLFRERCLEVGAAFHQLEHTNDTFFFDKNVALAVEAVELFDERLEIGSSKLRSPLTLSTSSSSVSGMTAHIDFRKIPRPPGRLETMQTDPLVILDGAHNPQKMDALVHVLKKDSRYSDKHWRIILAIKEDKDSHDIIETLLQLHPCEIITTNFVAEGAPFTSHNPQELADIIKQKAPNMSVSVIPKATKAIQYALQKREPVLVTGSLYLVGEVRAHWRPVSDLLEKAEEGLLGTL